MSDREFEVPWGQALLELILKVEPEKQGEHAQRVESLTFDRLQQPVQNGDGRKQREEVRDALAILLAIKHEKLGFPDWK
jgi:hypothetical protein